MECFCGCGRKVPRKLIELNLRVGEMALELLAWSKALAAADPGSPDTLEIERLVDQGAGCYRRLLFTLHGERDIGSAMEESGEWMADSRATWRGRSEMTEKGSFMRGPKLRFTDDDFKRLDRVRPERSFAEIPGSRPEPESEPDPGLDAAPDIAGQLERLGALRSEGILTEEEFRAAKARVLG
jgi:Short C-terminal domain